VWRITTDSSAATSTLSRQQQDLTALITRWAPRPHLATPHHTYYCSCEALLIGHEDWVHSVAWRPLVTGSSPGGVTAGDSSGVYPSRAQLCLLSASQDRSMILWVNDAAEGLWLNATSLGDAGASCFGYYGGCFSSDGLQVMAHGFTGALHLWKWQQQQQQQPVGATPAAAEALDEAADPNNAAGGAPTAAPPAGNSSSSSSSSSSGGWQPVHAQGGHFGAVADLSWGADGACLQTVSTDQTARMWTAVGGHWCEMARTQVSRVTQGRPCAGRLSCM
jgi:elongator complex protein 2